MNVAVPERNPANPRDMEHDILTASPGRTKSIIRSNTLWRVINERLRQRKVLGDDPNDVARPDQYDPVVELAVMGMDASIEPATRATCHYHVAKFLYPTLTAVQVTNDDEAGKRSHELNMRLMDMLDKQTPAAPTPKVIDASKITEAEPGEHGGHD